MKLANQLINSHFILVEGLAMLPGKNTCIVCMPVLLSKCVCVLCDCVCVMCVHASVFLCYCLCVCVCVYVCVCVCVYMCI